MKSWKKIICCFFCITLAGAAFIAAPGVFAAETESLEMETQEESAAEPQAPTEEETEPPEEGKLFKVTITQTGGGTVSVDKDTFTEEEAARGEKVTVTVAPNKGYGVSALYINGKSVGATYSYSFTPTVEKTVIKADFRKSSSYVFIMLDAGHFGSVNRSPVLGSYYESKMTWPLHLYLKKELEAYKNVAVDTTRSVQSRDMNVYDRGTASKGYNLFLSLHSNATGSSKTDYPLVITQKGNTKDPLAVSLGQTMESMINTRQPYQIWQRLNKDGKTEYYGVLRGAKSVGTKGMIIEHSFHTNLAATRWLSADANLKKMAEAEAADIAAYYGLSKSGNDIITPSKPAVTVTGAGYNALTLKWKKSIGATGYKIYRASSKAGSYKLIKTAGGTTLHYKNSKLTTGKTYYYKVRPYRKAGSTVRYGTYSAVRSCKVRPSTPSVSSSAGKRSVKVTWKKVSGASRYAVYRSAKKNGKYKRIATLKNYRRSYTNTKLKKGKRYYYKVRAYRIVKGKNAYSLYSGYTTKKAK